MRHVAGMAVCLAALVALPAASQARSHKKKKATAARHHKKPAKKVAARAAKGGHDKRPNLPAGWTWPPSDEMLRQGERCKADLDRLGLAWEEGPETDDVATPVVVPTMQFGAIRLEPRYGKGPWVMDCHLARALVREVSPALSNMHVTTLRFGQIHKVRSVAGKPGVLSRHALGMAMDIYAFDTDDGVEHVVLADYPRGDEVLLEVERRVTDSGAFRALLTPRNDPERHDDHFHFEARAPGDKVWTQPVRDTPVTDVVVDPTPPAATPREIEGPPRALMQVEGPPRVLMSSPARATHAPKRRR